MKRPYRSPIEIPFLVKDLLINKSFCELGCGEGDLLTEFDKYTKSTIGIENDPLMFPALDKLPKKIEIIKGDCNSVLNTCVTDVYYFWNRINTDKIWVNRLPKSSILITHANDKLNDFYKNEMFKNMPTKCIRFQSKEMPVIDGWPNEILTIWIRLGL